MVNVLTSWTIPCQNCITVKLNSMYGLSLFPVPFFNCSILYVLFHSLIQSSDTLYSEAEKHVREGDEELAYIHFMKYFSLISHISKTEDFSRDRDFYGKLLGPIKAKTSIEKAELLKRSLIRRLLLLYIIFVKRKCKLLFSFRYESKYGNQTIQSLANDHVEKRYQAPPQTSKIKTNVTTKREIVSVKELYDLLQMPQFGVLIMDCRPQSDFEASRIIYANCLNVPEKIIRNG